MPQSISSNDSRLVFKRPFQSNSTAHGKENQPKGPKNDITINNKEVNRKLFSVYVDPNGKVKLTLDYHDLVANGAAGNVMLNEDIAESIKMARKIMTSTPRTSMLQSFNHEFSHSLIGRRDETDENIYEAEEEPEAHAQDASEPEEIEDDSDDNENYWKIRKEKFFFRFAKRFLKTGDLGKTQTQQKLSDTAKRLGIHQKATLILAELLFSENILSEVEQHRELFLHFTRSDIKAQMNLIGGIEYCLAMHAEQLMRNVIKIFKKFYDLDLLEDKVLIAWRSRVDKKFFSEEFAAQIHEKLAPFITRLKADKASLGRNISVSMAADERRRIKKYQVDKLNITEVVLGGSTQRKSFKERNKKPQVFKQQSLSQFFKAPLTEVYYSSQQSINSKPSVHRSPLNISSVQNPKQAQSSCNLTVYEASMDIDGTKSRVNSNHVHIDEATSADKTSFETSLEICDIMNADVEESSGAVSLVQVEEIPREETCDVNEAPAPQQCEDKNIETVAEDIEAKHFQCDLCDKNFPSKLGLSYHMRSHLTAFNSRTNNFKPSMATDIEDNHKAKKALICEYCGKKFLSTYNLMVHLRSKRTHCVSCNKAFKCISLLRQHFKDHNGSFACGQCKYVGRTQYHIELHNTRMHVKKLSCETCGKRYGLYSQLKEHQMYHRHGPFTNQEVNFECPKCDKQFRTPYLLKIHLRHTHSELKFHCDKCSFATRTKNNFIVHLKVHLRKFSCDTCQKKFSTELELQMHRTRNKKCSEKFPYKVLWHQHLREHKDIFKCDKCPYMTLKKFLLYRHLQIHKKNFKKIFGSTSKTCSCLCKISV